MWTVRLIVTLGLLSLFCHGEDDNPAPNRGSSRGKTRGKKRSSFQEDEEQDNGFSGGKGSIKKTRSNVQQGHERGDGFEENNSRGGSRNQGQGRDKAADFFQGEESLGQGSRTKMKGRGKPGNFASDEGEENDPDAGFRGQGSNFEEKLRPRPSRGKPESFNQEEPRPKVSKFDVGGEEVDNSARGGLRGQTTPQEPQAERVNPPPAIPSKGVVAAAIPKGAVVGTASKVDTLFQTGNQKTCGVKPIIPKPVPATWVGSFPGSGAEVTWQLIQAITGLATDEDTSNIGHAAKGMAVAIKTHFPSLAPAGAFINLQKKLDVKQAILLIRNPMSAIPSYFNFQWEQENGLKQHTRRAPPNKWVEWRNGNFENELVRWVEHVRWWADSFQVNQPGKLHVLVFERLVSPDAGVDELVKLGRYLRNVSPEIAESMIPFKEYGCVWKMLVQPPSSGNGVRKRSDANALRGPRKFPYTSSQIQLLNHRLTELKNEYAQSFQEFSRLMHEYLTELETQFLFMKTE